MTRKINTGRTITGAAVASTIAPVNVDAGKGDDVRDAIVRFALGREGAGSVSIVLDTDTLPLIVTVDTSTIDALRRAAADL